MSSHSYNNNVYVQMLHQTHTTTELDRYPDIFDFVKNYNPQLETILSFGCSSGEECFSLRKYFSKANIYGVDINLDVLQEARGKNTDELITFSNSLQEVPSVDAIFAMSVLCRHPESSNLEYNDIYSFESFNTQILSLHEKLLTNGMFVIYNSNYLFSDTDVYHLYKPVLGNLRKEFVRKFNKQHHHIEADSPLLFIKQ